MHGPSLKLLAPVLTLSLAAALTPGRAAPVQDDVAADVHRYFDEFQFRDARLSPDGKTVAAAYSERPGVSNLLTLDTATLKPLQITQFFHSDIGWFRWIDDGTLSFNVTDSAGWAREDMVYNTVPKAGGDITEAGLAYGGWKRAKERARDMLDLLYIGPAREPGQQVVSTHDMTGKSTYPVLYRFDPYAGSFAREGDNADGIVKWFMDPKGQLRAAMAIDQSLEYRVLYREKADEPWTTVFSYHYGDPSIDPVGFDASGKRLYVLSDVDTPTRVLREFDPATKKLGPVLYQDPKSDVRYAEFSYRKHSPVFVTHGYAQEEDSYLDPEMGALARELQARTRSEKVKLQVSTDGKTVLAHAYTDPYPGAYYLYHPDNGKLVKLFDADARFAPGSLAVQKPVDIKARDGVVLPSYLTTPVTGHGPWPLVVMVHGGPFGVRDWDGYLPEVQLLAHHGYAVLQVNFRGSGGLGRGFEQLGWKQWGTSIQDDLADATRWAIRQGAAAEGRICIYGASFGGYSALMGMTRYPELFRCGVSLAGVTDLDAMLARDEAGGNPLTNAWYQRVLGQSQADKQALDSQSPIHNIDAFKGPLFIAHGSDDAVVPPDQSAKFVEAFRQEGRVPLEYLVLPREGHGVRQSVAQVQFYSELLRFLDANTATPAAAGGAP